MPVIRKYSSFSVRKKDLCKEEVHNNNQHSIIVPVTLLPNVIGIF